MHHGKRAMMVTSLPKAWEIAHYACHFCLNNGHLLICDGCEQGYHIACIGLAAIPTDDWFCQICKPSQADTTAASDMVDGDGDGDADGDGDGDATVGGGREKCSMCETQLSGKPQYHAALGLLCISCAEEFK
jgi:hypothetical protein